MFSLLKPTFSLLLRPRPFSLTLQPTTERSPTDNLLLPHSFGKLLSPVHFRRRFTRPVSYYAFFKGLLLLSKPPGCLCTPTTFRTWQFLGALTDGLGCFPLDNGAYPPQSY